MALPPSPSIRFTNTEVFLPDGPEIGAISVQDGRLSFGDGPARDAALPDHMILPGIIDLHGDGFERHLAPRRGAVSDKALGLRALEAELATHGITTAWLAQFFSWEGGMRGPDFAEDLTNALARYRTDALLDLRLQLRFEVSMLDQYDRFAHLALAGVADYVVFNDHLPHAELAAGKRPPRLTGAALKARRSPEKHLDLLKELHANMARCEAPLSALAARLRDGGLTLGSHDDETCAGRDRYARLGARIAEFPLYREVARHARDSGSPIVMGAPNVVRGGSHKTNVSARDLICDGLVDALVSDYHYAALPKAAFSLADRGDMSLADAWVLISAGPARILDLDDRGALLEVYRADLTLVERKTRRIEGCFAAGRPAYLSGALAAALMADAAP